MGAEPTLLQRVARGDRAAATACIETYRGLVWSLARRRLANPADAEDAVQDIFMQLWRQAGRFDPERGEEVTFVSVLARRRLVDRLRRQQREPEPASLEDAERVLSDDGHRVLERSAEIGRVMNVLEKLEPKQREVIHLSSWLGLSHGAIAERTGLPLGTVKSHLRRGLMNIRERLGEARAGTEGANP
jgi:RNA polymerase sigma-70 factor (ECF subfamily)